MNKNKLVKRLLESKTKNSRYLTLSQNEHIIYVIKKGYIKSLNELINYLSEDDGKKRGVTQQFSNKWQLNKGEQNDRQKNI
jgi:hypothetical protein